MSAGTISGKVAERESTVRDSRKLPSPFGANSLWVLLVYSIFLVATTVMIASRRHLWWDEIQTMLIASLPSLKAMWSAMLAGADWQSPGVFLPLHYLCQFFGASALVGRLIGIVPYWLATLVLYYSVARRTTPAYGFIAMLFPSLSGAFIYSFEMRPYASVLLLTACTFLSWQLTKEYRFRRFALPALTVSLGTLACVHYNACLVALPLLAGEAAILVRRKKADYPVLISISCAALFLIPLIPHIRAIRHYSAAYHMPHTFAAFLELYTGLFSRAIVLAPLAIAGFFVWRAFSKDERPDLHLDTDGLRYWEIAAAATFLILPIVYFFLSIFTGALHYRHVLDTVIGASVLLAFLCYAWRRSLAPLAGIVLGLLALNLFFNVSERLRSPDEYGWGTYARYIDLFNPRSAFATPSQEPIVMGAGPYLVAYKYGAPELARRSFYLMADPQWRQAAPDAVYNRNFYRAFREMLPPGEMHADGYSSFIQTHDRFLLYDPDPWLVKRLAADGRSVEVEAMLEIGPLYSVTRK